MDRLTMTSDKGGLAFTFNLDFTCQPSEARKILALGERLKAYEDVGTVEDFQRLIANNRCNSCAYKGNVGCHCAKATWREEAAEALAKENT